MKPKHITKRAVTFLLAVVLLTGCLIPHAANNETAHEAGGITDPLSSTTSNIDALPELSTDSTLLSDPESLAEAESAYRERMQRECAEGILADSKIADYINTDEFFETKPMFRLTALETLNSYVIQNADNTNTIYLMAENVKYVDTKGEIREKDIRLSATEKGFGVTDSDVKLLLPNKVSSGISVNTDFGSITLTPRFRGDNAAKLDEKSNSVSYNGAFGNGTFLRYTPTLSGVKEDIVLEVNPESNSFEFMLEADGLTLYTEDSIYYLVSTDNKDCRIRFDQIFIYDTNGRFTAGKAEIVDASNGRYTLTVTAPREFLDDAETTYPVTIDPSITVSTETDSAEIIDAAVHQGTPNMNAGTWPYDNIGYTDSTYGLARTVIKLNGLLSNPTYQNLTADKVTNVSFSAKEATGNSSKTVKLHPITGNPTWTETSVTWNNYGSFDTTVNYGGTLTGDQWTAFNITNLVKAWLNGSYNNNGCFIFIMGGTENSQCRALYSTEYSGTSNRPYLSLTYTSSLTINDDSVDVEEEDTYQLSVTVDPPGATITYSVDDTDIATVSSTGLVTGIKAGTTFVTVFAGGDSRLAMIYVVIEDGVYTLKNAGASVYLTVDGVIEEEHKVRQKNLIYAGNPDYDRIRQMWKIRYLGYGRYSVRPVRMLFMGLSAFQSGSNTYVTTHNIGTMDYAATVPDSEKWAISRPYSSQYIRLTQNGQSGKAVQAMGGSSNDGASAVLGQSSGSLYALWLSERVNPVPIGIYLYNKETHNVIKANDYIYIAPEEELDSIMAVGYSGTQIDQFFVWSYLDHVEITDYYNLVFKGVSPGIDYVQVRWNVPIYVNNTATYMFKVTEVANGTYFLKNKQSGKYADIYHQEMEDGTNVHQWEFHGGNTQRWIFTRTDGEYYTIVSANSATPYYLGLENESNLTDNIVIRSSFLEASCKWKVEKKADGSYKIMTQKGTYNYDLNGLLYVMSVASNNSGNNGGNIQQLLYTNDSNYRDEWVLFKVGYASTVSLEGQNKSNWCWVTSSRMFSKHFFSAVTYTQTQAVTYIKGSPINEGGSRVEAKAAINYYISNIAGASIDTVIKEYSVYSENTLKSFLDDDYVVYISRRWYNDLDDASDYDGGHATLVFGYVVIDSEIWFLVRDPWPVDEGETYMISYNKLYNGRNPRSGESSDTGIWYASIVVNTSYVNETITYYFG